MKTFLTIGYSSGIFWHCLGDPTDAPGQSCTKIPTLEVAAAIGLVLCLAILIALILSRLRKSRLMARNSQAARKVGMGAISNTPPAISDEAAIGEIPKEAEPYDGAPM
jgi:hypothetical protein